MPTALVFHDAVSRARSSRCETPRGGTLFLDEIGDLPLALRVELLRVFQEGDSEFFRVR